ncbi:MAG: PQQ-binding-like beta-propeller repeat protein [Phycisphaerales bacterium]|nr:PQQ-binding-like beta-propeller repeat protein [Phycisphaerales bacterium]
MPASYKEGIALLSIVFAQCAFASDWPAWRGPDDTGAAREKAVATSWSPDGENVLWKSDIGGRTTPIVLGGRMYFLAPVGEGIGTQERVVCLDAATGKLVWENRFNVYLTDVVENRVGWTAMAGDPETGNVYAHATGGELFAFDRDGKLLWKRSLTEEFGRISGYGGRLYSPVVDEDRVIIGMNCAVWGGYAKGGHRFIAFDKRTGEVIWFVEPGGAPLDTTYATPVVAVIGGVRQLICPCADGFVYGLKSRTGERLWAFQSSRRPLNTSPVVDGNLVYVTHSEENIDNTVMGRTVCIDVTKLVAPPAPKPTEGPKPTDAAKPTDAGKPTGGAKPSEAAKPTEGGKPAETDKPAGGAPPPPQGAKPVEPQKPAEAPKPPDVPRATEVWRADGVDAGYCSPALANGRLYVVDNSATLYAFDSKTGEQKWKQRLGRVGKGSPVVTADGVIYYGEQNGYVWILKDEGDKCAVLDKEQLKPVNNQVDEVFGSPAVVDGHVFLMTRYATYALGAKHEPATSSVDAGKDAAAQKDAVRLRLLPAEVSLQPGETLQFKTNAKELQLAPKEGEPFFKVNGVKGTINDGGLLTIAKDNVFSAGTVVCPAGNATARVRVSPNPPFKFDFESVAVDGVPPGWIGVGGKSKVVEMGGGKVLMKLAEQPSAPMMRMRAYMTPPIAGGYTMAADMMSTLKPPTTKADIGLINSRYRLLLMGELNVLRIDSWDTMPRVLHDVPLNWKEGIWMRMKFQVQIADKSGGGQEAHLRGKVWATDEPEPKDWMIEFTDPYPNTEGSPGPYAYSNGTTPKSKGAEVYFDNIEVTKNE